MDDLITAIKTILKNAITAAIALDNDFEYEIEKVKTIFFGDPIFIPQSNLPALAIMPGSSAITSRGTSIDQADRQVRIKLIQNVKDFAGADSIDPEKIEMYSEACRLFERVEDNIISQYSIVGALRKSPKLMVDGIPHADWDGNYSVNYEFTEIRGYIAFETTLTIMVKKLSDRFRS